MHSCSLVLNMRMFEHFGFVQRSQETSTSLNINKLISEICSRLSASLLWPHLNEVNSTLFKNVAGSLPLPCHLVLSLSPSRYHLLDVQRIIHNVKSLFCTILKCRNWFFRYLYKSKFIVVLPKFSMFSNSTKAKF